MLPRFRNTYFQRTAADATVALQHMNAMVKHPFQIKCVCLFIIVLCSYIHFPNHLIPYIVLLLAFTGSIGITVSICLASVFWTLLSVFNLLIIRNVGDRVAIVYLFWIAAAIFLPYLMRYLFYRKRCSMPPTFSSFDSFMKYGLVSFAILLIISILFRPFSIVNGGWAILLIFFAATLPGTSLLKILGIIIHTSYVFIVIMFFSCLITEFASRILIPNNRGPAGFITFDPFTFHTLKPSGSGTMYLQDNDDTPLEIEVEISSQGLRNEIVSPKKPDEFRILTIGDSFTMGQGLSPQDTYQSRLAGLLNQDRPSVPATVINGGVLAFAPWQEHAFLLDRGFEFAPDMVILQLFPANDIAGSLYKTDKRLRAITPDWERPYFLFRKQKELPQKLERWFLAHSNLYRLLLSCFNADDWVRELVLSCRLYRYSSSYTPPVPLSTRPAYQEACLKQWYPELEQAWDIYASSIRAIRDDCRSRNIPLIAFAHGFVYKGWNSYDAQSWQELNEKFPETPYEMNKDIRLTQELLAELDIPFVDITQAVSSYNRPKDLFYINDGHFSPAGAQIIAECIFDFLQKNHFLTGVL